LIAKYAFTFNIIVESLKLNRVSSTKLSQVPSTKSEKKRHSRRPYSSNDNRRLKGPDVRRRESLNQLSKEFSSKGFSEKDKYSQLEFFKEMDKSITKSNLKPRRLWIDLNDIRKSGDVSRRSSNRVKDEDRSILKPRYP
jgi:hypothetical protein